jgi:hypothetical protein
MSDESSQLPRPTTDDRDAWRAYWQAQGMPWRTEPEIDAERQRFLIERRAIHPDIERGIYPFRDENGGIKLTRADVEWLLTTYESGGTCGPVDWSDWKQRDREGLDLRGAELRKVDLSRLPLARMHGGLNRFEWTGTTLEQRDTAAVHLEQANLSRTHLEAAHLARAHLEGVFAYLAYMETADLYEAHLEGINLSGAHLEGASLRRASFDGASYFQGAVLGTPEHGSVRVAGTRWGEADLSVLAWSQIPMLGDEDVARERRDRLGHPKDKTARLQDFQIAVRANRQLATALRDQGLNEDADRFAYRAQLLQRVVLRRQGAWLRWAGSLLLGLIAGYGYRPLRSVIAYVLIICAFAGAYLLNGKLAAPHLRWDEALVLSISSFHGRGFFTTGISLGDTLARLAAGEAIIGLLIEITFIATFTQRFFAR